jgi:hypothetical protein
MPPQLTEAWASAYLQILIGLFVFALGIPAFIFQLVVSEDIRHVTERRMNTIWWKLAIVLLGIASVSFVWLLHPYSSRGVSEWKKWIASAIVTVVPVAVALIGLFLLGKYKREKVISGLKAILIKQYQTKGLLEGGSLEDIIYLGKHGKAGYEKELVLKAYAMIAKKVQSSSTYKGRELQELINSLPGILGNREMPGNDENYYVVAELLKSIRDGCSNSSLLPHPDAHFVNFTLTELGLEAIQSKSERTALKLLNVGASCNSGIVLRMGICAFGSERFLIAANALNLLETEVESEASTRHGDTLKPSDATSRLLGLIAHFAASDGAARRRAQTFFRRQDADFYVSLKDCLGKALDYYYDRSDFETANKITALSRLIEDGSWPVKAC